MPMIFNGDLAINERINRTEYKAQEETQLYKNLHAYRVLFQAL